MPAVTLSENDPTVEVWDACGQGPLLRAVTRLAAGKSWGFESGVRSFGQVLIRADQVALAYGNLAAAADTDPVADQLLIWMRAVPERQTFGVRAAAASVLDVDPDHVGVKCGWDTSPDDSVMRTHAVTVTKTPQGDSHITAVLTAISVDETALAAYTAAYSNGQEILGMHQKVVGRLLAQATADLLA